MEENVALYGNTTFFMKRDGKCLIQYGFTTEDENSVYKKHTYSYNMFAYDNEQAPCDLVIDYESG